MTREAYRLAAMVMAVVSFTSPAFAQNASQNALRAWSATEVWRIDGTESGEPFFDLRDYLVGKDGALWVLDFKDQLIRRFDSKGKALPSVGRKGSGPGEFGNANGMLMRRDGSVWVNDPRNGRLTVIGVDGKFVKQHLIVSRGYGYRWNAWLDRANGELIDPFINQSPGRTSGMDWRRISESGAIRDTFPIPSCASGILPPETRYKAETKDKGGTYGSYPFATGGGSAPDGFGAMWCSSAASTRVSLVRIGTNDTLARTTIEIPRVPVQAVERDEAAAAIEKRIAQYAATDFDRAKIPTTKPGIAMLTVDDDSRVWVQHAQKFGDRSVTFDIHDKAGKHLGRLRIPHRPSAEGLPIRARGDDLWIALRDEDDVIGIARYRIVR